MMSDKNNEESKSRWISILDDLSVFYFVMVFVTWIAFSSIGSYTKGEGFLKALVWPYSVIEWNVNNE